MTHKDSLSSLKNQIFKVIHLKENNSPTINEYIDSLYIQVKGTQSDIPSLITNYKFNCIVNIIAFLKDNEFTFKQCRREVLKCTNTIDRIIRDEFDD